MFTASYPYGARHEDTFVGPELPYLTREFDRVVLIPTRRGGGQADPAPGVVVEDGLAELIDSVPGRIRGVVDALASPMFWREFRERPIDLVRFGGLGRLLRTVVRAHLTSHWLRAFLQTNGSQLGPGVAYTFWCDAATTGIAMTIRDVRGMGLVSRAHGVDLYAERHQPPYFPARAFTFARLDGLFPDSHEGLRYITERYPEIAERSELARMGVPDPGFATPASQGSNRVIVSCSRIVPIKRIDLIGRAVAEAARLRTDLTFEWHHFGDGEGRERLETEARAAMPGNALIEFHGYEGLQALMGFYKTHPVDAFVNASTSEGTPVSVMEAVSCGIPVVATAVGGNTEIVTTENGETVAADSAPSEIAAAILRVTADSDTNAAFRDGSRRIWHENYNAETNYPEFARRLALTATASASLD
jgi:colanic acid/amylovoran biosynthesis glycosyltransferase